MVGGFDTYDSFKKWLHYWCEVLLRAVTESKSLTLISKTFSPGMNEWIDDVTSQNSILDMHL